MILYTDIDPCCGAVLEARVGDCGLPAGDVLVADVRDLDAATLATYSQIHMFCGIGGSPLGFAWAGWPPEWSLVTGGFPCQDVSSAGKGAGLDGARSGLYREMIRVIDCKRPLGVLSENVGALSARGLERVACDLESLGYLVTVLRVGAWAVGAPDTRERWWFVCRRANGGNVADIGVRGLGAERVGGAGAVADQSGSGVGVADLASVGRLARGGKAGNQSGSGVGRNLPTGGGHGGRVGDEPCGCGRLNVARRGPEARGVAGGAGGQCNAVADVLCEQSCDAEAGRGGPSGGAATRAGGECRMEHAMLAGLEGQHVAESQLGFQRHPGPARWPHPRWSVRSADGIERTVPTPQYDWEPPRLYPGSRTVNARWRCALMGYPIDWLDVPEDCVRSLAGPMARDLGRWWNKQGVIQTGNAQNPRVVEVLAASMLDAITEIQP